MSKDEEISFTITDYVTMVSLGIIINTALAAFVIGAIMFFTTGKTQYYLEQSFIAGVGLTIINYVIYVIRGDQT